MNLLQEQDAWANRHEDDIDEAEERRRRSAADRKATFRLKQQRAEERNRNLRLKTQVRAMYKEVTEETLHRIVDAGEPVYAKLARKELERRAR